MPIVSRIKRGAYQDSVRLMRISETLSAMEGVEQAFAAMGTDANKRVLKEAGLQTDAVEAAGANDLVVVIEAGSEDAATEALGKAEALLAKSDQRDGEGATAEARVRTLEQARERLDDANLELISVPGPYAALEAAKALHAGLHVFLFSNNVALEDEVRLKKWAASKGLLLMGPDCGTAVINGVALAFANVLRRGPVGVVAASGTGLQELTTLVDRGGSGISQAIGVGGRDLSDEVGGIMMRQGIDLLAADEPTEVLVLISKPPAERVAEAVLEAARASGKPVIVNFLGDERIDEEDGVRFTGTLEDTAEAVLRQIDGEDRSYFGGDRAARERMAAEERGQLGADQQYVRGLYTGGTLCEEAVEILSEQLSDVYSNVSPSPEEALDDVHESRAHSCIDLGAEEFTQGRPHPMIDPRIRQERLLKEATDASVAVILLDVVIGYGAHDDPAGALAETIRQAKAQASAEGRHLAVVAHVCGTEQDPQGLDQQEQRLRDAGVRVLPTNAQAAHLAASIIHE